MALGVYGFAPHLRRWIVAPLVPLAAALTLAAPAHADEQSFIDYLNSHGVPTVLRSATLGDGYKICAQIHEGMSPDDAINQYMVFRVFGVRRPSTPLSTSCARTRFRHRDR